MILFIDDEKRLMDSYVAELRLCGFDVAFESNVDKALRVLEERRAEVELLILDVMMPSGESFSDQAKQGFRTGVRFYERVRETQRDLPIILLTNFPGADIIRVIEGDPHCQVFQKLELLPYELADVVTKTLER